MGAFGQLTTTSTTAAPSGRPTPRSPTAGYATRSRRRSISRRRRPRWRRSVVRCGRPPPAQRGRPPTRRPTENTITVSGLAARGRGRVSGDRGPAHHRDRRREGQRWWRLGASATATPSPDDLSGLSRLCVSIWPFDPPGARKSHAVNLRQGLTDCENPIASTRSRVASRFFGRNDRILSNLPEVSRQPPPAWCRRSPAGGPLPMAAA